MGKKKGESNLREKTNCLFNQTTAFRLAIQMAIYIKKTTTPPQKNK